MNQVKLTVLRGFLTRKLILTLVGMSIVAVLAWKTDLETTKWVGGFVAGLVGAYVLGQGIADGGSGGRTALLPASLSNDVANYRLAESRVALEQQQMQFMYEQHQAQRQPPEGFTPGDKIPDIVTVGKVPPTIPFPKKGK